jgi:hypothetical protein
MQKTVYYLTHVDTQRRLKYYTTLAGARIAQRLRNRALGFTDRVERVEQWDNWEVELCTTAHGELLTATWAIVETTVDSNDEELFLRS